MKVALLLLGSVLAVTLVAAKGPLQVTVNRGFPLRPIPPKKDGVSSSEARARLPRTVTPQHYEIQLIPILETVGNFLENTVHGTIKITLLVGEVDIPTVTLNAFETVAIDPASLTVTQVGGAPFAAATGTPAPNDFYVISVQGQDGNPANFIANTQYDIAMSFVSQIHNPNLDGDHLYAIYKTSFVTPTGDTSLMATTQFEPTGAREAFPCFDEPEYKATFLISIGHSPADTALCNQERTEQIPLVGGPAADWVLSKFSVTEEMSTYLVALVVANTAEYTSVTGADPAPEFLKTAKVYGPAHLVNSPDNGGLDGGQYAADQSVQILKYFQTYTDMNYTFDKMDSVAIPDFDAGAMENWGLNTYQFQYLLNYPGESTEASRLLTTEILSHELIHQWFGNIITCSFWDQIWMNEGFADYFQYYGVAAIDRGVDFKALDMRQFESAQAGLEFDDGPLSHPVINDAAETGSTYDDFSSVFTPISYAKAGTLLRMLEDLLTTPIFQAGLRTFLTTYSHQPVSQDQLFEILTNTPGAAEHLDDHTVKDIMDTWTLQNGFPLLRVSKASSERVYVSQERFRSGDVMYSPGDVLNPNHLWTIPLRFATPLVSEPEVTWLEKTEGLKSVAVNAESWVLVNPKGNAFYRVLYDPALLQNILGQLDIDHETFETVARSQLLDDYFVFAAKGMTRLENALSLTRYLGAELEPVPWHTALYHLAPYLNKLLGGENADAYNELDTYMTGKLTAVFADFGIVQDPMEQGGNVTLRSQLVDWACALKMEPCLEYARNAFAAWTGPDAVKIPVDVRSTLLCSAVSQDDANFVTVLAKYQEAGTSEEDKARLLSALACTEVPARITELLGHVVAEGGVVDGAHKSFLLSAIGGNTVAGRDAAIDYLVTEGNLDLVVPRVTTDGVDDLYETLSNFVISEARIGQLDTLAEDELLADVVNELKAEVVTMTANRAWRAANEETLQEWFAGENGA